MWQKHSIILWKEAEDIGKTFDAIASETYDFFSVMQGFPAQFRPVFQTTKSKRIAREATWDYNQFKEELRKRVNREGRNTFEELGYTISFFSSMSEDESCSITMTVGNKNPRFFNTLIIGFPFSFKPYDMEGAKTVKEMFSALVKCFKPFWGCVSNAQISRQHGGFITDGIPTTVHWINYWSSEVENSIGSKELQDALRGLPDASMKDGILILQDLPFNIEDKKSLEYHQLCHKRILG